MDPATRTCYHGLWQAHLGMGVCPTMSELVVLRDTGKYCRGYPVFARDTQADQVMQVLSRGLPARLLRLHGLLQAYLAGDRGRSAEPCYLLLSDQEGGFARTGFHLGDQPKEETHYIDLARDLPLAGRFGALDQTFAHELGHVLMRMLVGERPAGGANQVHAVSVRTDPVLAFDEGFAEHLQVMTIDDADADPATRELTTDAAAEREMLRQLAAYRAELCAGALTDSALTRRFPYWFSQAEQRERYFGVKANLFASKPEIPADLLVGGDPYRAYLIESVVPGGSTGRPRTPSRAVACEGFVSTFWHRLVTSDHCRNSRQSDSFYGLFGVGPDAVTPLDNAYLKAFHAIRSGQTMTLAEFVESYCSCFPAEAAAVRATIGELLHGQELRTGPALWLANPWFATGTSLFDQFRSAPRVHTFDINAASLTDLVAVPGIDVALAQRILAATPITRLDDLDRITGMTGDVATALRVMAAAMTTVSMRPDAIEAEFVRLLPELLTAYASTVMS